MSIDYTKFVLPWDKPLSIRLIQIQPGNQNDDICLSMRVVNLDPSELLSGENPEPTGRPLVRFDEMFTGQRPEEYFGLSQNTNPHTKNKGSSKMLSSLVSKLKISSGKGTISPDPQQLTPLTKIPVGEPMVRNRWKWGNYVALSYSWGPKEEWEMSDREIEDEKARLQSMKFDNAEERAENTGLGGEAHEVVFRDDTVANNNRRVKVRYNLWSALLRLREMAPFRRPHGVWLWNDALCINQADIEEKTRQLDLMPCIYGQAGNVVVHAGDAYLRQEDTPWVLDYLQGIGANYRTEYYEAMDDELDHNRAQWHRHQAQRALEKSAAEWVDQLRDELRPKNREHANDYAMESVYDFFDRPYWRRLWIIQELAAAHHAAPIVCGGFVTQWRYIRDAALLLSMLGDTIKDAMQRALLRAGRKMKRDPSFQHVAAIGELAAEGNRKRLARTNNLTLASQSGNSYSSMTLSNYRPPLLSTLYGSSIQQALVLAADTNCFFDRDRVYGLLAIPALSGLFKSAKDELSRLSTADMYTKFAAACITNDRSLDIFALLEGADSSPDIDNRLPSWCPRFHMKTKIGRIEGKWDTSPDKYRTWKSRSSGITVDSDALDEFEYRPKFSSDTENGGTILTCHGWVVDTVDGLGAMSASDMTKMRSAGGLFKSGVVAARFRPSWTDSSDSNIRERIWKTLVGGTGAGGENAPGSFACLMTSFPEITPDSDSDSDSDLNDPESVFLYQRNLNFLRANGPLRINNRPLSSYFTFQPQQPVLAAERQDLHKMAEAHRSMETRTKLRRLMTTSNQGCMGLVPATTQQGDVVVILTHHNRPLIASVVVPDGTSDDEEDFSKFRFNLKGEAFIPGIMEGELADELDQTAPIKFDFY